jgi:cell division septation protein DedD
MFLMFSQINRIFGRVVLTAVALTAVLLPAMVRAEERDSYTCLVPHDTTDKDKK